MCLCRGQRRPRVPGAGSTHCFPALYPTRKRGVSLGEKAQGCGEKALPALSAPAWCGASNVATVPATWPRCQLSGHGASSPAGCGGSAVGSVPSSVPAPFIRAQHGARPGLILHPSCCHQPGYFALGERFAPTTFIAGQKKSSKQAFLNLPPQHREPPPQLLGCAGAREASERRWQDATQWQRCRHAPRSRADLYIIYYEI